MLHSLFKLFSLKYIWNSIPNYLHISRSTFGTCTSQIPFWTAAVPLLCPAMVGSSTTHTACSSHVPIILEVLFVSTRPSWKSAASPPLQINLAGSCSAISTGATVIPAILISPLLPLAWRSPTPEACLHALQHAKNGMTHFHKYLQLEKFRNEVSFKLNHSEVGWTCYYLLR